MRVKSEDQNWMNDQSLWASLDSMSQVRKTGLLEYQSIRIDNTGLFELKTTASQDKSKHVLDWSDLIYGNFGLNESVLTSKPRYDQPSQMDKSRHD